MKVLKWLIVPALCFVLAPATEAADVVYLVRHAEKQVDGGKDPGLTAAGRARVCHLERFFADKGLDHVLSSDYRRTRETAGPIARSLGLEVEVYDPRHQAVLAMMIKNRPGRYLVVGHSNTLPELSRILGGEDFGPWAESEYERFYELRLAPGVVETRAHRSEARCPAKAD